MKKIFFFLPVLLGIYVPAMATDSLEFCIYNDGAYVISNFFEGCSWDNDWYGQYTKVTWKASGNVADHSSIACHTKSKK